MRLGMGMILGLWVALIRGRMAWATAVNADINAPAFRIMRKSLISVVERRLRIFGNDVP